MSRYMVAREQLLINTKFKSRITYYIPEEAKKTILEKSQPGEGFVSDYLIESGCVKMHDFDWDCCLGEGEEPAKMIGICGPPNRNIQCLQKMMARVGSDQTSKTWTLFQGYEPKSDKVHPADAKYEEYKKTLTPTVLDEVGEEPFAAVYSGFFSPGSTDVQTEQLKDIYEKQTQERKDKKKEARVTLVFDGITNNKEFKKSASLKKLTMEHYYINTCLVFCVQDLASIPIEWRANIDVLFLTGPLMQFDMRWLYQSFFSCVMSKSASIHFSRAEDVNQLVNKTTVEHDLVCRFDVPGTPSWSECVFLSRDTKC